MNPDDSAYDLIAEYKDIGLCAFVVRATPDGKAVYLGHKLPRRIVRKMLLDAADAYLADTGDETLQ